MRHPGFFLNQLVVSFEIVCLLWGHIGYFCHSKFPKQLIFEFLVQPENTNKIEYLNLLNITLDTKCFYFLVTNLILRWVGLPCLACFEKSLSEINNKHLKDCTRPTNVLWLVLPFIFLLNDTQTCYGTLYKQTKSLACNWIEWDFFSNIFFYLLKWDCNCDLITHFN